MKYQRTIITLKVILGVILALVVIFLIGAGTVGFLIRRDLSQEIFNTTRGTLPDKTPADMGLEYVDIEYDVGNGVKIRGWFIDAESKKCIIMAPGKGRTRTDFLYLAPFLHGEGYDLLLFDPRSTGESEGEKWGFGYFESRDILEGIEFAKRRYGDNRFGVLGVSTGASAALMAAIETTSISAIVADSPFASIKLAAESYGNYGTKPFFRLTFPLYMFGANRMVGVNVANKTDLRERVSCLEVPVLFIHGDADQIIDQINSKLLYEKKPGEKEIWITEGVGHGRSFVKYSEEYEKRVIEFFGKYL